MNTLSNMVKVAVVGGEGIGPEVTAQSHRILNWFVCSIRGRSEVNLKRRPPGRKARQTPGRSE